MMADIDKRRMNKLSILYGSEVGDGQRIIHCH